MQTYDVVIVGAGPVGIACAIEAKKHKLNYVVIEKGSITNSLRKYPTNMTFFSTSEKLEIDNIPFNSINLKPTRPEALEYYRRVVKAHNLKLRLHEKVNQLHLSNSIFTLKTTKQTLKTNTLVLATGYYDLPNLMHIPGENLTKVSHYYKEPWLYNQSKLLVIGAANSAVDAALECHRKGAEVTMAIRGKTISERVKYWVKPDIENRIKEGSLKAYFNTKPTKITPSKVFLNNGKKTFSIPNDFVLALTGYRPDYSLLKQLGVNISDQNFLTPCFNGQNHMSNIPNLYLAGVVCGGLITHKYFIENSMEHAQKIISSINHRLK